MLENREPGVHDHESDPAHTPGAGWADEGGASHLGPATHIGAGTDDNAERFEGEDPPNLTD